MPTLINELNMPAREAGSVVFNANVQVDALTGSDEVTAIKIPGLGELKAVANVTADTTTLRFERYTGEMLEVAGIRAVSLVDGATPVTSNTGNHDVTLAHADDLAQVDLVVFTANGIGAVIKVSGFTTTDNTDVWLHLSAIAVKA